MSIKISRGMTVIITGASGGLGTFITHEFARRGVNLTLVACPGAGLEPLKQEVEKVGGKAIIFASDLREPEQRRLVIDSTLKEFGAIDILINNAGVEMTSFYHELSEDAILGINRINLEAPMILSWLALPHMLAKRSGHIVNMSSLAGKLAPGYQEPYAASKAGLVNFTMSLRATYAGTGVSASVICPGFVEAGIYERLKRTTGCVAPASFGTSQPKAVVNAVIRAIERDKPEIIVNPLPCRPLICLHALMPAVGEWLVTKMGAHKFFRRVRDAQLNPAKSEPAALPSDRLRAAQPIKASQG
jgi:short-subunit dehydrogenase